MKKLVAIGFMILPLLTLGQSDFYRNVLRRATFYAAVNGGNSVSDQTIYSVTDGLTQETIATPFDYSLSMGVRKIARFGYENRANVFYDGTEQSYGDAATIGKVSGFEFLSLFQYRRLLGQNYLDQHHFLRYVDDWWLTKFEYLQNGFADIKYFEASQRFRWKIGSKFSLNAGFVQRISEPYGYDPLEEWLLSNGNLHYTFLAIQEGYSVQFDGQGGIEYFDPSGKSVATSTEVWEAVVIPEMLANYTEEKRDALPIQWTHSWVAGFDYYKYTKTSWLHAWGNVMPLHYSDDENQFSYYNFNGGQWIDYSGGIIFGHWLSKNLGLFVEGTYNKYWNRTWHGFSAGINYRVF